MGGVEVYCLLMKRFGERWCGLVRVVSKCGCDVIGVWEIKEDGGWR